MGKMSTPSGLIEHEFSNFGHTTLTLAYQLILSFLTDAPKWMHSIPSSLSFFLKLQCFHIGPKHNSNLKK